MLLLAVPPVSAANTPAPAENGGAKEFYFRTRKRGSTAHWNCMCGYENFQPHWCYECGRHKEETFPDAKNHSSDEDTPQQVALEAGEDVPTTTSPPGKRVGPVAEDDRLRKDVRPEKAPQRGGRGGRGGFSGYSSGRGGGYGGAGRGGGNDNRTAQPQNVGFNSYSNATMQQQQPLHRQAAPSPPQPPQENHQQPLHHHNQTPARVPSSSSTTGAPQEQLHGAQTNQPSPVTPNPQASSNSQQSLPQHPAQQPATVAAPPQPPAKKIGFSVKIVKIGKK
jgi:hypothetical protein